MALHTSFLLWGYCVTVWVGLHFESHQCLTCTGGFVCLFCSVALRPRNESQSVWCRATLAPVAAVKLTGALPRCEEQRGAHQGGGLAHPLPLSRIHTTCFCTGHSLLLLSRKMEDITGAVSHSKFRELLLAVRWPSIQCVR